MIILLCLQNWPPFFVISYYKINLFFLLLSHRRMLCAAIVNLFSGGVFLSQLTIKVFSLQLVHNFSVIFPPLASLSRSFEVKRALTVNNVIYKNSTYSSRTQTNLQRSLCKCNSNRLRKKNSAFNILISL